MQKQTTNAKEETTITKNHPKKKTEKGRGNKEEADKKLHSNSTATDPINKSNKNKK